jgi:cytochrome c biogenesis protein CcmG/thiol:disulfide interchange protein DsbE
MRRMLQDYGAVALLVIAVLVLFGRHSGGPSAEDAAPAISVPDLDGTNVELADLAGSNVVLNFWASWCGPCKAEIPEFAEFAKANPDVKVIGVAVDSGSTEDIEHAAKTFGISYRVAVADPGIVSRYQVSSLPTTVIIDKTGRVKSAHVGMLSREGLEAALRE